MAEGANEGEEDGGEADDASAPADLASVASASRRTTEDSEGSRSAGARAPLAPGNILTSPPGRDALPSPLHPNTPLQRPRSLQSLGEQTPMHGTLRFAVTSWGCPCACAWLDASSQGLYPGTTALISLMMRMGSQGGPLLVNCLQAVMQRAQRGPPAARWRARAPRASWRRSRPQTTLSRPCWARRSTTRWGGPHAC